MAKLPTLPVVTSLAADDLVYAVDISDTTDDPSGTSVAIAAGNLPGGGGGTGVEMMTEIEIATDTDPASGGFSFTIPAGYDSIEVRGNVRSGAAGVDNDTLYVFLNGDFTPTNYHSQGVLGQNAGSSFPETGAPRAGDVVASTSTANAHTSVNILAENIGDADLRSVRCNYGGLRSAGNVRTGQFFVTNNTDTAALTQIDIRTDNYGTDDLTGTLTVYGRKKQTVGGGGGTAVEMMTEIEISTQTDPGAGTFVFSLPTGYESFEIRGDVSSSIASSQDTLHAHFNADLTDSDYYSQILYGQDATSGGIEAATPSLGFCAGSTSVNDSHHVITIPNPEDAEIKNATGTFSNYRVGGSQASTGMAFMNHDSMTASLTSITLSASAGNLSGTFTLFGKKKQSVGGGGGGATAEVETRALIEEIEFLVGAPTTSGFLFSAIPATYTDLVIECEMQCNSGATGGEEMYIYLNGDTTVANYYHQRFHSTGSSSASAAASQPHIALTAGTSATQMGLHTIELPNYTDTVNLQLAVERGTTYRTTSSLRQSLNTVYHKTATAAITSIQLVNSSGGTIYGNAKLYGRKQETVGGGASAGTVEVDVPVVQSAVISGADGSIKSSTESGWSCVKNSTGDYTVTFPTAVATADDQAVVVTRSGGATAAVFFDTSSPTTTTIEVNAYTDGGVSADSSFSIVRRIADTTLAVGGGAGNVQMPVLQSAYFDGSDGSLISSTGTDVWGNATRTGAGIYIVDFPDAAPSLDEQYVHTGTLDTTSTETWGSVRTLTTTDMTLKVSDASGTSADRDFWITRRLADVAVAVTVSGNPTGTMVTEEIARITNATAGDFDFDSIPGTYDRLIIKGTITSDLAGVADGTRMWFNTETTDANYHSQPMYVDDGVGGFVEAATSQFGLVAGTTAVANSNTSVEIVIENYASATDLKSANSTWQTLREAARIYCGRHVVFCKTVTAPITRLRFRTDNHATDQLLGTLILYGERTL